MKINSTTIDQSASIPDARISIPPSSRTGGRKIIVTFHEPIYIMYTDDNRPATLARLITPVRANEPSGNYIDGYIWGKYVGFLCRAHGGGGEETAAR